MTLEYEQAIKIGLTEAALTNIESLNSGDFPAPKQPFWDYPRREQLADLSWRGLGLPKFRLDFGIITQAQRDALAVYCTNLVSCPVFVELLNNDDDTKRYSCVMVWPDEGSLDKVGDKIIGFAVDFAGCVDITPIPEPS
jgi:hypothetical protein